MTAPVFFADLTHAVPGEPLRIEGPEARHMRVMRVGDDKPFDLVDGAGRRARVKLTEISDSFVSVIVEDVADEPVTRPKVTLIQALAKGGRDELAIEMATELGVDKVIAWESQRAIVRWPAKKRKKAMGKWENILRAATKQARRSRIPELEYADSVEACLKAASVDQVVVMHESATTPISEVNDIWDVDSIALVVGPEGGITDAELEEFEQAGAKIVLVGNTVMRVSTASTVGLALIRFLTAKN